MSIVIDASIALSWCFEDEASPETDALADRVAIEGGIVPALWHVEVTNVLLQAEKRGRISAYEVGAKLEMFGDLLIETDYESVGRAWRETLLFARFHKLTSYDATYLELAIRRGVPLATLDKALAAAARVVGVVVD
jgi:predicted nucleic acid-binding protein